MLHRLIPALATAALVTISVDATEAVTTFAGSQGGVGHADGPATAARFSDPVGLAIDAAGNVLLADSGNHCIRRITPAGVVTTIAGTAGVPGSVDGTAAVARFDTPSAVAVGADGTVFISDTGNHTVRRLDRTGRVSTLAGKAGSAGATNGAASTARFNAPLGLAVSATGSVFVADSGNHLIRRINADGTVSTLAGVAESWGDEDGPAATARFNGPVGLVLDPSGALLVADALNHTVRRIAADGVVSTLVGSSSDAGFVDGPAREARLGTPAELALDARGNLYVADALYHTIRRLGTDGRLATVAGLAGIDGGDNGAYTAARFFNPYGMAITPRGTLVVTDTYNATLRELVAPFALRVLVPGRAIQWESQPGQRYQVYTCTDWSQPWTSVGSPITASGTTTEWTDTVSAPSRERWYQIRIP
jgi:sugar lactone lactonase YvrE